MPPATAGQDLMTTEFTPLLGRGRVATPQGNYIMDRTPSDSPSRSETEAGLTESDPTRTPRSRFTTLQSGVSGRVPSLPLSVQMKMIPSQTDIMSPVSDAKAYWMEWRGDDRTQAPRLPGVWRYRVVSCLMFIVTYRYIAYRAYSMARVSALSHFVFACECMMAATPLLMFATRYDFTDTRGTTPSLTDLTASPKDPSAGADDMLREEDWPTVAILITVYTEDRATIEPTLDAALDLDYPPEKLHVLLCDDASEQQRREQGGGADWLAALCAQRGAARAPARVTHLRRRKPAGYEHHAKAGNINAALGIWGHGDGGRDDWPGGDAVLTPKGWQGISEDYMCIFDADMCPHPQFLQRTLPFFYNKKTAGGGYTADNRVSMVQVPQRFSNLADGDPLDHSQTMNYDCNMCAFDANGTVNCCGTGCIFRRSAMMGAAPPGVAEGSGMSPPGMQYGSLIEDVHTSMVLHMHGWTARYINEDLQTGLAPLTLEDTFNQRTRWINGGAQLVRLRFLAGDIARVPSSILSFRQKLAWTLWFGSLNALVPVRLFLMFVPVFILYFHNRMYSFSGVPWIDDTAYACGPLSMLLMVASIAAQPGSAPFRLLIRDLVSQVTYAPMELIGLKTIITNRPVKFTVTSKDNDDDVNAGRCHPALVYHVFFVSLYTLLLCKLAWLYSSYSGSAGQGLGASMQQAPGQSNNTLIYAFTFFFLVCGLCLFQGIASAVITPLPARRHTSHLAYWDGDTV